MNIDMNIRENGDLVILTIYKCEYRCEYRSQSRYLKMLPVSELTIVKLSLSLNLIIVIDCETNFQLILTNQPLLAQFEWKNPQNRTHSSRDSNPGPFIREADALPLHHCDTLKIIIKQYYLIK